MLGNGCTGREAAGHLWPCSRRTPDTLYGFADKLPSNICANLRQHALTAFQSGIISRSSSASLCVVPVSPPRLRTGFKHPPLLLFNPRISFFSWPCSLNLYLPRSASHTGRDSLFSYTPVALAQGAAPHDLSVRTCGSRQGYFAPVNRLRGL